jgi:hypothetical protein
MKDKEIIEILYLFIVDSEKKILDMKSFIDDCKNNLEKMREQTDALREAYIFFKNEKEVK